MRTPLALLRGELEAIADGVRTFDDAQLASLQAEVSRLTKLVDDLYHLSLADLGGLRYEFSEVALAALLALLCSEQRHRFEDRGLHLTTELPSVCLLEADPQRLGQLFLNLLENSRAYTDAPGEVHLSLLTEDDAVTVLVDDSAPGVSETARTQLFDPLFRTDTSRNRRAAGAGLGLAICRAVVEAHQGSIEAHKGPRGGLRSAVKLPRKLRPDSR